MYTDAVDSEFLRNDPLNWTFDPARDKLSVVIESRPSTVG